MRSKRFIGAVVDGLLGSLGALIPYIERGVLRPVIRGRVSEPEVEKLPVDEDLTTDNKGKIIMAIRSATDLVSRPFVAPPRTPVDIMNILREAFAKAAKDPNLQADAKKADLPVKYVPEGECLKVINYIFSQPPDIVSEFSKYITF